MPGKKSKKGKEATPARASARAKKGGSHDDKDADAALKLLLAEAEEPRSLLVNGHQIAIP